MVKGSTTTEQKMATLRQESVEPFLIECQPGGLKGERIPSFFKSDILFLNIPFRRNFPDPGIYKEQIEAVVKQLESSAIKFLIFASSTSVYPDSLRDAREDVPFEPETDRSRVLFEIEQSLLKNTHFDTTIIRFAGLCGGERRVGNFLTGQKNLSHGDWPVNLIHLEDCIAIVTEILEQDIRGEIFNACSDQHPARRELYTQAALKRNRNPPGFEPDDKSQGKIVSNEKLKTRLGYHFKYPSPLNFP